MLEFAPHRGDVSFGPAFTFLGLLLAGLFRFPVRHLDSVKDSAHPAALRQPELASPGLRGRFQQAALRGRDIHLAAVDDRTELLVNIGGHAAVLFVDPFQRAEQQFGQIDVGAVGIDHLQVDRDVVHALVAEVPPMQAFDEKTGQRRVVLERNGERFAEEVRDLGRVGLGDLDEQPNLLHHIPVFCEAFREVVTGNTAKGTLPHDAQIHPAQVPFRVFVKLRVAVEQAKKRPQLFSRQGSLLPVADVAVERLGAVLELQFRRKLPARGHLNLQGVPHTFDRTEQGDGMGRQKNVAVFQLRAFPGEIIRLLPLPGPVQQKQGGQHCADLPLEPQIVEQRTVDRSDGWGVRLLSLERLLMEERQGLSDPLRRHGSGRRFQSGLLHGGRELGQQPGEREDLSRRPFQGALPGQHRSPERADMEFTGLLEQIVQQVLRFILVRKYPSGLGPGRMVREVRQQIGLNGRLAVGVVPELLEDAHGFRTSGEPQHPARRTSSRVLQGQPGRLTTAFRDDRGIRIRVQGFEQGGPAAPGFGLHDQTFPGLDW